LLLLLLLLLMPPASPQPAAIEMARYSSDMFHGLRSAFPGICVEFLTE